MRATHLITLVLAALAAGCAELPSISPGPDLDELAGEPVQLTPLQEHIPVGYSGFGEQAQLVVETEAEWEEVWLRLWRNVDSVPPVPAVDFGSETVLVAAMGARPTGGYAVRLESAAVQGHEVVVRVVETSPAGGCGVRMATSSPADVVKMQRTSRPTRFQVVQSVRECP